MCIAIYKPKGISIPSIENLSNCFSNNPHGAGFATFADNPWIKGIMVMKGFFDFQSFYDNLFRYVGKSDVCLIHFRYATHGTIDESNCHPFTFEKFQKDVLTDISALIHNGVINNGEKNAKNSDTYWLTRQIEAGRSINNEVFKQTNNKVAILNGDQSVELYGNWIEDNGVFYSNGTYRFDCEKESKKQEKKLTFCDCCGILGESFFETDVGYHFCDQCLKDKITIFNCKSCGLKTTNHFCNLCNNLGKSTNYFNEKIESKIEINEEEEKLRKDLIDFFRSLKTKNTN